MNQRAQSVANGLLRKLERKTDYQIRYEILDIIKELPMYCSKQFKVGSGDHYRLFDALHGELSKMAYNAWKDVKEFEVTAEYRMKGRSNNMSITLITCERDMFEAKQRVIDQTYINLKTGRRFKPAFIKIDVEEIKENRVTNDRTTGLSITERLADRV